MSWTKIAKPNTQNWTRQSSDDTIPSAQFDIAQFDESEFGIYSSTVEANWTKVSKPASSGWSKQAKPTS